MLDEKAKLIRERHLNYLARMAVDSALTKHGPLTLDALAVVLHWDYGYTADIIAQLRERNKVAVAGTLKLGATGRPVNVYGLRYLHVPEPTTREKLYALLCDKGDSPCLELSRELDITPKSCRYHLGRLLAARKVRVVGTLQRATGGTPAAIWSADV